MVRHVILWKFKETLSAGEREQAALRIKRELEALAGQVDGMLDIQVSIRPIAGSNMDLMLDSSFVDEAALEGYQVFPAHLKVKEFVKAVTESRACMDTAE